MDYAVWSVANWGSFKDTTCIFSIDCSVSADNNVKKANSCVTYPNPTFGELRFDQFQPRAIFYIKSESVKTVIEGQLKSNNLNLSDLSPGLYFLEIMSDERFVYKLVKCKNKFNLLPRKSKVKSEVKLQVTLIEM